MLLSYLPSRGGADDAGQINDREVRHLWGLHFDDDGVCAEIGVGFGDERLCNNRLASAYVGQ